MEDGAKAQHFACARNPIREGKFLIYAVVVLEEKPARTGA